MDVGNIALRVFFPRNRKETQKRKFSICISIIKIVLKNSATL